MRYCISCGRRVLGHAYIFELSVLSRQTLWRAEDIMAAPSEPAQGATIDHVARPSTQSCAVTAADAVPALFRQFTEWQARATQQDQRQCAARP